MASKTTKQRRAVAAMMEEGRRFCCVIVTCPFSTGFCDQRVLDDDGVGPVGITPAIIAL